MADRATWPPPISRRGFRLYIPLAIGAIAIVWFTAIGKYAYALGVLAVEIVTVVALTLTFRGDGRPKDAMGNG